MKWKRPVLVFAVGALFAAASCRTKQKEADQPVRRAQDIPAQDIYTCSMHPQIHQDHPGNCPICGMILVKKDRGSAGTDVNTLQLETLLRPTDRFVVASLPVITLHQRTDSAPIRVYGTIEYDTRAEGILSARVSGRIEKMYVRYRYQAVQKGQKIMDIYSPELLTAEQNLLFLLENDSNNSSFIQAARERLLLLGMSDQQVQELIRTRKPLLSVGIYSNYSGHVHDAGIMRQDLQSKEMNAVESTTQELSLKEGMYIQKGQPIVMIMNHDRVWAALQIFPNDQALVRVGDPVRLIPETDTTSVTYGKIDMIEPFFRPGSKTLTARVYFHNMNMLPIGSHLSAEISTGSQVARWLPRTAVLSLGLTEVVFLKRAGGFMPHKITTGIRSGNDVQVLSGMQDSDSVAANAQYFMDSESFVKPSSK
ncbi:MAG: efflux RND transporter periplasmic adaptor subunit [Bacteroidota bacterium]|nr:efflux RND transporter periplasmic adaptor subunit [Bacteroidota bacterium]MDP4216808.1 efflux RND transporter periplasmic adaptor subunit [Bacteroidota bacterium]MDP4246930.1 efflux RND transporter periplasmic adaptor subunit [Bacteroidota bacterium]MDP4252907.1 efflux RND transporter periplasmic adaptor subunit [Bacteroidota bacterium]